MSVDDDGDAATITMPALRWQAMRDRLAARDQQIRELEDKLRAASLTDVPPELAASLGIEKAKGLGEALDAAIVIVGFAVGNLHPLTVRGWPWFALDQLAQMGLSGRLARGILDSGVAMTWQAFAREARKWEEARAEGREQALLVEENASRAANPEMLAAMGIRTVASMASLPAEGELMLTVPSAALLGPGVAVVWLCPACNRTSNGPGDPAAPRCQHLDCGHSPTVEIRRATGTATAGAATVAIPATPT